MFVHINIVTIFVLYKNTKHMDIYSIEVGNIYNDETESTGHYDYIEDAYYEAAEIAEEMHKQIIEKYKDNPKYEPEAFDFTEDIIYKEQVRDAYEYHLDY